MAWIKLDPITQRRLARFRSIKRGYYSLLVLLGMIVLSIFAPFIAESRALFVDYQGHWYFPTFQYFSMETFRQTPPTGWTADLLEIEYYRLQGEWSAERSMYRQAVTAAGNDKAKIAAAASAYPNHSNFVIMPAIPWDPYQSDFWSKEILTDIQTLLDKKDDGGAVLLARKNRLNDLADAIGNGSLAAALADAKRASDHDLASLAHGGTMPALAGLGVVPPNPPALLRAHYLGTDTQGRDVASRLLYGFRISIFFALFLTFIGQAIGTIIGSLQGYLGGMFDLASQRIIEIMISIPFLYVVIILAALFVPSFWLLLGVMAVWQWIDITFYMRTQMYREKTREYCLAAQSYGASHWRIVFRHLLPNCLTPLVTFTPFAIVGAIFALTALDYLGYGLPPPTPSWGQLIDQALDQENRDKLWLILAPFGAITITLALVVLIGESVREAFDPKQYAKYE